ncbi:MAG TPA: 50S ribosomal protein L18 [Thermodesulfobacteriota bacterium]|nr:50S ribosomal protein L18 [Thermodesulfobacteriota bacterium]
MAVAGKKLGGWERRKRRVRNKVLGTQERPRLSVYRSNKHIYAQIIDDTVSMTLAAASTASEAIAEETKGMKKTDAAKKVGELIGRAAKVKGIEQVVFDRSGYIYHGRVKAVADGAREAGLKF